MESTSIAPESPDSTAVVGSDSCLLAIAGGADGHSVGLNWDPVLLRRLLSRVDMGVDFDRCLLSPEFGVDCCVLEEGEELADLIKRRGELFDNDA